MNLPKNPRHVKGGAEPHIRFLDAGRSHDSLKITK